VSDFHKIVDALEEAFGADLSVFRIPDAQMKPLVVAARPASRSGRLPGYVQRSKEKYCDEQFALRQIDGIVVYFENLQPSPGRPRFGF